MARPKRVSIAGRPWSFTFLDLSGHSVAGLSDSNKGVISIADDQTGWEERDTVLHEVLHSILRSQGRPYAEVEEEYVRALATGLIGVLRSQPDLAHYLFTEKIK